MLTKGDESCQADEPITEIDFTTPVNDQLSQKGPHWPVGLIDTGISERRGAVSGPFALNRT